MELKEGVSVRQLTVQGLLIIIAGSQILDLVAPGTRCVVTSGDDGKHGFKSKHYRGDAVDFRTRNLTREQKEQFEHMMKKSLGKDFDVILEDTHLHVEYDPKGQR